MFLKQSTASQEILLGPFVDSTDGVTPENALTIANTDIKLFKAGATSLASKNSGGATYITSSNGHYYAVLDATDTDTLGNLEVNVYVAGALPVRRSFVVLPAVVYDSIVSGTDNLDVNTVQLAGTAQTARDIGASVLLSSGTGTGQISLNSGAVSLHTTQGAITYSSITCTGAWTVSDGIIVTCSTSNRSGINVTGNGTGHGMHLKSGGGATGNGLSATALSTNGHGIIGTATGSTGNGIYGYGGTTNGNGIKGQGGDTSGYGIEATAASGAAMHAYSTSGYGFEIVASGGNNAAIKLTPAGSGNGINGTLLSVVTVSGNVTGNVGGNVTGSVGSVTGNVGGNVVGSVASVTGAVGSVTGSVGSVATGGITAASIATGAIDADSLAADAITAIQAGLSTLTTGDIPTVVQIDTQLTASHGSGAWTTATGFAVAGDIPTAVQNADALLNRNIDQTGNGTRTVEEALAVLRNKSAIASGTLTVYDTDDATSLWTATVTSSASADPITGVDPA